MSPGGNAKECEESEGRCCVMRVNLIKDVVGLYSLNDAYQRSWLERTMRELRVTSPTTERFLGHSDIQHRLHNSVETKALPDDPLSAELGHFKRAFLEWYGQKGGYRGIVRCSQRFQSLFLRFI